MTRFSPLFFPFSLIERIVRFPRYISTRGIDVDFSSMKILDERIRDACTSSIKSHAYLHTWSSYLRRILGHTRHTVNAQFEGFIMHAWYLCRWPLLNSSQAASAASSSAVSHARAGFR